MVVSNRSIISVILPTIGKKGRLASEVKHEERDTEEPFESGR